ncbi:MAG: DegT/DnrJ/EryC1/StrS family aminotransferase [Pseudomonadota bacterium]
MTTDPIPLFDPQAQYARLRPAIDRRIHDVLEGGRYVLGAEVDEFEAALADLAGVDHAVTVANGTDALLIALLADGIGPGDAVFVPSFTFIATAGAVVAAGATPVFCDVDASTFNLDPGDLTRALAELPGHLRARAVIPVDLFGQPADYAGILEVAAAHDLLVLSDAAQSLGGALRGVPVGGIAPVTATSFYPTKPLGAFGDGGAILTDDGERAARMRDIRVHGGGRVAGLNSRLDTLQAAVLLAKLESFAADRDRRAEIATQYEAAFDGLVGRQQCPSDTVSAFAVYVILHENRDALQAALNHRGISSRAYYATPLHRTASMRRFHGGYGDLPGTDWLSERILALPIYPDLDDRDVARIRETVLSTVAECEVPMERLGG